MRENCGENFENIASRQADEATRTLAIKFGSVATAGGAALGGVVGLAISGSLQGAFLGAAIYGSTNAVIVGSGYAMFRLYIRMVEPK